MKFVVQGTSHIDFEVEVEANTEEEAIAKARWDWEGGALGEDVEIKSVNEGE